MRQGNCVESEVLNIFLINENTTSIGESLLSQSPSMSMPIGALFKSSEYPREEKISRKSSRPSLEDDIRSIRKSSSARRKSSNKTYLRIRQGSQHNQENENIVENGSDVHICRAKKSSGRSAKLSQRDSNVFRFNQPVPTISVDQEPEDDVFVEEVDCSTPLLLTPSTASSCSSIQLDRSPCISQGIACNTPSRRKLETHGLGVEKLVLGRGAFGTVVLGRWRGKKVAVKVMEKEEGEVSARRRKSLESELQAVKMDHENIVKVHSVFAAENKYAVILMEYVGSRNLHRLLTTPDRYLSPSWLVGCGREVASALNHCHSRGVVHMDVKPANILVTSAGVCKLGDFGCSLSLDCPKLRADHSMVGTSGYQAPEFLRGGVPSTACDIYSLGIMFWQLDSRQIPFQGVHPHTVIFGVVSAGTRPQPVHTAYVGQAEFSALYRHCWDQEASLRPSAAAVGVQLGQIIRKVTRTNARKDQLRI